METTRTPDATSERSLAIVALVIGLLIIGASLLRHGGDIAGLVKFGDEGDASLITAHAESLLDREVATAGREGHDGRFFFLQSLDPLLVSPDEHAALLDRPVYRTQRMLYPLLAGAGGFMPASLLLWSMAATNLAALIVGTVATGRLARSMDGSHWLGLAFALNPGVIFEFDISGAGIVAFAAAVLGTLALVEGRHRASIGWFVAAVLAREVMLLYLAGVCCWRLLTTRRIPWTLGAIPALSALAWAGYTRLRLDSGTGVDEVQEFGPPFGGMLDALDHWLESPIDLAVIAGLIAVMPLLVLRAMRRPNPLAWGALGFVLLATVMTRQVWWNFFDITRAVAPIITAYALTTFAVRGDDTPSVSAPPHTPAGVASPS